MSPRDWLLNHVGSIVMKPAEQITSTDMIELYSVIESLAGRLDQNVIAEIFWDEMNKAGYFKRVP